MQAYQQSLVGNSDLSSAMRARTGDIPRNRSRSMVDNLLASVRPVSTNDVPPCISYDFTQHKLKYPLTCDLMFREQYKSGLQGRDIVREFDHSQWKLSVRSRFQIKRCVEQPVILPMTVILPKMKSILCCWKYIRLKIIIGTFAPPSLISLSEVHFFSATIISFQKFVFFLFNHRLLQRRSFSTKLVVSVSAAEICSRRKMPCSVGQGNGANCSHIYRFTQQSIRTLASDFEYVQRWHDNASIDSITFFQGRFAPQTNYSSSNPEPRLWQHPGRSG